MVKRFSCIILCLFFSMSSALTLAEEKQMVVFHNIPWLSDETTALDKLSDIVDSGYQATELSSDEGVFLKSDEELLMRPVTTRDYLTSNKSLLLTGGTSQKIAGYDVNDILLTFAKNGDELNLVCVRVELKGAQYADLATKLQRVYGECEEAASEDGIKVKIWKGSDESCALLYSVDDGRTADLFYGRLDAESMLANSAYETSAEEIDPDDISGL